MIAAEELVLMGPRGWEFCLEATKDHGRQEAQYNN
jgi:hypothetical protein